MSHVSRFGLAIASLLTAGIVGFATNGRADADISPPTLTSFQCTPSSVDIGGSAGKITCTASFTDDQSGVQAFVCEIKSPARMHAMGSCAGTAPTTGNRNEGEFECTGAIAQYSETGTWTVTQLEVWDNAGNGRTYSTGELAGMDITTQLQVTE